jgi:hypothetical protein
MLACTVCGEQNPDRARFCLGCGAPIKGDEAPPAETRKVVTVVFSDLAGSTSLGERLDPESLSRLMARWFERARVVLERHGGTVQKFIGGAVMAVFGIPTVREEDALRAVRAAAELHAALAGLNHVPAAADPEGEGRAGGRLPARLGEPDRAGPRAPPGPPDGRPRAGAHPAAAGGGRRRPAPRLPPGDRARHGRVGKSRLVAELLTGLEGTARVLSGRCLPYGKGITFWPVAEVVRQAAGMTETDLPADARAKLRALLGDVPEASTVADRIAQLLGLGDTIGPVSDVAWAVRKLLEALARERLLGMGSGPTCRP